MDTIYLKIVTCIVRINFHPFYLDFARDEMIERIKFLYGTFILAKYDGKVDLIINFYHSHSFNNKVNKKTGEEFAFIYQFSKNGEIYAVYTMSIYQFQGLLYKHIARILPSKNILLLHASASKIRGKAYLFLGISGAGKSTALNLIKEKYTPLGDDSVFIHEEDGEFYLYQTPFYERNWLIKKKKIKYHIGGVFFIHKSKKYSLRKEPNKNVVSTLFLKQVISVKIRNKKYLKLSLNFVLKYNNFSHLYFGKDSKKMIDLFEKMR